MSLCVVFGSTLRSSVGCSSFNAQSRNNRAGTDRIAHFNDSYHRHKAPGGDAGCRDTWHREQYYLRRGVRRLPSLRQESGQVWEDAVAATNVVSFKAGTQLTHCSDASEQFTMVLTGRVRVYESAENGREICL